MYDDKKVRNSFYRLNPVAEIIIGVGGGNGQRRAGLDDFLPQQAAFGAGGDVFEAGAACPGLGSAAVCKRGWMSLQPQ